jgi:hypothetical protein
MAAALCCHCHRCNGRTYHRVADYFFAHGGNPPMGETEAVNAPELVVVKPPHRQLRLFNWETDE